MTTIAWDGTTLAGDRRITGGGEVATEMTKVAQRKDGAIIGVAGETCTSHATMRWFIDGEQSPKPDMKTHDPGCNAGAIIVRPNGNVEVHDQFGWHPVESKHYAIGSGGTLALVAMHLGQTAVEAVKTASKFDIYTNNKVNSATIKGTKNGK